jgi:hypothetical protein
MTSPSSPYITARSITYWEFPSSVERLTLVPDPVEVGRIAWQKSDDSFWILLNTIPEWKELGSTEGGEPSPTSTLVITLEAGETLTSGTPVYVNENKLYTSNNLIAPRCEGICVTNSLATFPATMVLSGTAVLSGLTPGANYYVGEGLIQTAAPVSGKSLLVGTAISSTVLLVNLQQSVLLN